MPILKELWILTKDGLPIVCINEEGSQNEGLVCGFFSAMKTFSSELMGKNLQSFQLGDEKISMSSCLDEGAILVCKTIGIKEKKIHRVVKIIKNMLEKHYKGEDLKSWNGDVSFFDKFKSRLDIYFKLGEI